MGDPIGPLVSVRASARRAVPPDYVLLASAISVSGDSKPTVLRAAAAASQRLVADLVSRGGVPLRVDTEREPLTFSVRSATTRLEEAHNERTGRFEPTGQVVATVDVLITVRDLGTLDGLSAVLASHEDAAVHQVVWGVDPDNGSWPAVRAAAISAAIQKGRDYAAALGGSLRSVEHIADVGLLGDGADVERVRPSPAAYRASSGGAEPDTPSLDPVPQELTATIEARFAVTGPPLSGT